MATSVNAHPGEWLDGVAVAGQDLRLQTASAFLSSASPSGSTGIAARPGIRYGSNSPLSVGASSGMNVTVDAGVAWVQGTASATAGMYTACLDTQATLTVTTSDPTNPRIDNVIVQVVDNGNSSSTTTINIQAGTPAPSPVAPTLPANSLLLATIAVGAGVSSITSANITNQFTYTASAGGIVPMTNSQLVSGIAGGAGNYAHNLNTGRLLVSDGLGNAIMPTLAPFNPQTSTLVSSVTVTGGTGYASVLSVSVTAPGNVELAIYMSWAGIYMASPIVGYYLEQALYVDGTYLNEWYYRQDSTSSAVGGGGSVTFYHTPAAGTHTYTWEIQVSGGSNTMTLYASGSHQGYMRVSVAPR